VSNYGDLVPIIAPVFVLAGVGFVWAKLGFPFEREFVTRMVMNVGAPCLVISSMTATDVDLATIGTMLMVALVVFGSCAIAGALILKLMDLPKRSFLPPLVFGNFGNLGLPLCLFAFGQEGIALAICFFLVGASLHFTLGPLFMGSAPVLATLVRTPVIYAAIVAIGLVVTGTTLPLWISNSVDLAAGSTIPLMLLALGNSLGSLGVGRLPLATRLAVFRLGLGLATGLAAVWLFELDGVVRGVVIIQSAMPAAVFNFLLASRYDRHPDDVAGIVVISNALALVLLPFIVAFALAV
jgi:predicted permease